MALTAPLPPPTDVIFEWWGRELALFDHPYNSTLTNERAVEVAVANAWLCPGPGLANLEVGNVLGHYDCDVERRVVDRYEVADGVENLDVFDIEGEYDQIVAVSTLEHVRWNEKPRLDGVAALAIEHLCSLLTRTGRMLVTIPTGWNPPLDQALRTRDLGTRRACTIVRSAHGWYQSFVPEFLPYGEDTPWASSVWIGEWGP